MEMEKNFTRFETKDLYLASFLQAKGKFPVKLERRGNECWFIFRNENDRCRRLVDAYWKEGGTVIPKKYSDAIRSLKDRIFSVQ